MAGRDLARAEPVALAKHGRPVVVVMAVEEFERLKALAERWRPWRGAGAHLLWHYYRNGPM